MSASRIQPKPASWLWGTLTSIRLTVFLLLFTYFGVSFLLTGLHSYLT